MEYLSILRSASRHHLDEKSEIYYCIAVICCQHSNPVSLLLAFQLLGKQFLMKVYAAGGGEAV